jgi:hypothetical protein
MYFNAFKTLNCAQKKYSDYSRSQYVICYDENKWIDYNEHVNRKRVVAMSNNIISVVLIVTYKIK